MSEVAVDLDQLRGGAGQVQTAAQGMRTAADAGGSAQTMSEDAFGILCGFMAGPAQAVNTIAVTALNAMAAGVEGTSAAVNASVDDYDASDSTSATTLGRIGGNLP